MRLQPRLTTDVRGGEISRARQKCHSGARSFDLMASVGTELLVVNIA